MGGKGDAHHTWSTWHCPGSMAPLPRYLPVPLADVIQGQRKEVVLGAHEETAALLVQQQGLVAAGVLQREEAQPMASPQLCRDPPALLSPAPPLPVHLHCPGHAPRQPGSGHGPLPCHPLPQTCPTGLTRFTKPLPAQHSPPCQPHTHPWVP